MVSANSIQTYENFIKPNKKGLIKEVFEQIGRSHPKGITLFEVAEILDKDRHQISGRTSELVALELIILSGEYKKIPHAKNPRTDHGIWILTKKGQETYNKMFPPKVDKDGQAVLF